MMNRAWRPKKPQKCPWHQAQQVGLRDGLYEEKEEGILKLLEGEEVGWRQ